jgi:hypothetical protein
VPPALYSASSGWAPKTMMRNLLSALRTASPAIETLEDIKKNVNKSRKELRMMVSSQKENKIQRQVS